MRLLLRKLILGKFLIISLMPAAQQNNNWYFGLGAGLSFNTSPPQALTNGQIFSDEGTATVSDKKGNLLFYTDGITVYNRLHAVMQNGIGLMGNISTTNSAYIVQKPGSTSIYYIFTADAIENNFMNGYRYSEVDMSLDGGLGGITATKNISLAGSAPCTERLAAVKHANGQDIWVITKEFTNNRFRAYLVSCTGINLTPIISDVGINHYDPPFKLAAQGQMKISPNGSKLCVAINDINIVELFDFNNSSGQISNPVDITGFPIDIAGVYGAEFSPNGQLLYVSYRNIPRIYQFDITSGNQTTINASSFIIPAGQMPTGMQIGPDKKIYVATLHSQSLSVINSPDNYGATCNFTSNSLSLNGKYSEFGLQAFLTTDYNAVPWSADFTSSFINCHVKFTGNTTAQGGMQWNWDFGDGNTATGQVVQHSYPQQGNYVVTLKAYSLTSCGTIYDSLVVTHNITVNNVFSVDFNYTGNCSGIPVQFNDNIILTTGAITGYTWYFGDGNTSTLQNPLHPYPPGNYNVKLVVSTSGVCNADSITKAIYVDTKPLASYQALNGCVNQPILFNDQSSNTGSPVTQWGWDFGGTGTSIVQNPSYTFTSPGNYPVKLVVNSEYGCADDTLRIITIEDKPVAKFTNGVFCLNQPVNFTDGSDISFGTLTNWQWNFGDNSGSSAPSPSHTYTTEGNFPVSLIVTSQYGCTSDPARTTAIIKKVNAFAGKDTVAIYSIPIQLQGSGGVSYQWTPAMYLDNATVSNPIATVTDDQVFTMDVTTAEGCFGSDDIKVTVVKHFDVYVPTGFTPNGDGKNEVLRPYPVGIKTLEYFRVYNRAGQLVFATSQVGQGWDGRINGKLQSDQVFVWMLKAIDLNGRMIEGRGTSVLIK